MRKLWVEPKPGRASCLSTLPPTAAVTEHEVVIEGPDGASGMTEVMQTLLAARSFERVETPVGDALLLEFRYPCPSTVALTYRA